MQNEQADYLQKQRTVVVAQVCTTVINTPQSFPNYSRLEPDALRERISIAIATVIAVVESGDLELLRRFAGGIATARLQTGFDPLELLNLVELMARNLTEAISAAPFEDTSLRRVALRRVRSSLMLSKMQIGSLNIAISATERLQLDPDIAGASAATIEHSGEEKV